MNSKVLQLVKSKLKKYLKDKEILDILLFGSAIKGETLPNDIDVAIITDKKLDLEIDNFHISVLSPSDFFRPFSLIHTLLREGYSLKYNMPFSKIYKFSNKVLFKYELTSLKPSVKVKIVNVLRGKKNEKGLVEEKSGEWLANQVFFIPVDEEKIFEKLFLNFRVKFQKHYVLIH